MSWLWQSLSHALAMLWATFWALVLGFTISGVLQVFVSKEKMTRLFGQTNLRSVVIATGLGAASSSCSYAAAAAGRSAIQQGAAVIPALAFMFASTNLVVELGVVLWLLMGWQFVLAEILGALVLITLMWSLIALFLPLKQEMEIKTKTTDEAAAKACNHDHHSHSHAPDHDRKWTRLAHAFVHDWSMLWKEILGGFLIAGFLAALVPYDWWKALFLQNGPPILRLIENAFVGPVIAVLSFVCSVGNIPLATLLWANGISFGGVISFIYADLIVVPLIIIYAKYYGARAAAWITGIFYTAMVLAGIIVDLIFGALDLIPTGPRPPSPLEHAHIAWNYTSWLDLAALVFGGWLLFLYFRRGRRAGHKSGHCH